MSQLKVEIKTVDMEESMQAFAKTTITEIFEEFRTERNIAQAIKLAFDKAYDPSWNCIVGKNYGSHVVHQTKKYIFCSFGELSVLLWKS